MNIETITTSERSVATKLNTTEAAAYCRTTVKTLAHYRHKGGGPRYFKRGARVFYDQADLDAWFEERTPGANGD